jgi:hypothetical protein
MTIATTTPPACNVDDAAEDEDDDAVAGDAEAEGAQVLVEMGRPASWRPTVESPLAPPSKKSRR